MKRFILLSLLLAARVHGQYTVTQRADGSIYGPAASLFFSNTNNLGWLTNALISAGYTPTALPSGTGLLSITSGVYDTPSTLDARLAAAASANRTALGLGNSATLNVGTSANTVAAGNDSRILGALQSANNLSDLVSASTARGNLGLGGAAVLNVGTTAGTVAAGNDSRITGALQAANNLSDLANAAIARTNLGVTVGGNVQPYNTNLTAIAGLTTAADSLPYFTGAGTAATTTLTTFGRSLIDDANNTAARTTLGLGGAAVLNVGTTTGTVAAGDDSRITGAAQKASNLSDLASATTARSNLGLGNSAILNVGTTAGTVAAGDDSRIVNALSGTGTSGTIAKYTGTGTLGNSIITESGSQASIGGGLTLGSTGTLQWSTDTILQRDAANTIGLRNGANQQTLNIYGTYTDASNYRRGDFTMTTAGDVQINAEGLGTGATGNSFRINVNGTSALTITSGGTATFGNNLQITSTATLSWSTRGRVSSPADAQIMVQNNAQTDVNVWLKFGLNTSAAPGLLRNGTELRARLNDDSNFAPVQSLYDRFGSGTPESNVTAPVGAVYHRTDGGANTSFYVKESGTGNTGWVAK